MLDLDESVHFYGEVLGLLAAAADHDGSGCAFFRAWDECDPYSVVLRQADTPGLDRIGFKVRDDRVLAQLERALHEAGERPVRQPEEPSTGIGQRLGLGLPGGHTVELYTGPVTAAGREATVVDPPAWLSESERGVGVQRLDHCVLSGPMVGRSEALFAGSLGFSVAERAMGTDPGHPVGSWLSTSGRPCDIAFLEHGEPGRLHHVAFRVASAEQVLRAADRFSMSRVPIDAGPFRDPVGRRLAVQALDPSGNRIEVFWSSRESQADAPTVIWSWQRVGAQMALRDQRTRERLLPDVT
ncbi:MAG TPA: VOC family protein [Burkholderiaceae bacterium]|nr:VOC family protein [Burkholderiaceae bacterium]